MLFITNIFTLAKLLPSGAIFRQLVTVHRLFHIDCTLLYCPSKLNYNHKTARFEMCYKSAPLLKMLQ